MVDKKKYCLDTNVFIEGWNKYYSMDLCSDYWSIIEELSITGVIFAPIEVKREIEKIDDNLSSWIKNKDYLFHDIDQNIQLALRDIMRDFPRLVDSTKQRSVADPWVIAHAVVEHAVVVTKEYPSISTSQRIKIPDVCIALKIPFIDDFQLAREIGIRFNAQLSI